MSDDDDVERRAYLGVSRGTLVKADDSKKLQELTIRDRFGDQKTNVEHWHPDGFTNVPLPPSDAGEAEVLVAYLGGSPDHPVVIATADRRHRPKDLQPGEKSFSDDQGQEIRLGRAGMVMTVPSGKSFTINAGGVSFKITSDGVAITGGSITHNGKAIDDTHKHGGIERGGALTDPPA